MTVCHEEFVNDRVPPKIWNDSEVMIPFCSPNFIPLAWKAKKLGEMGTACSLWAPCALSVHSLCAPCAPHVQPLCNPLRIPPFDHCLTTVSEAFLKLIWDTDPQDPGILIHRIQGYWSTESKMSLGYWSTALFWSFWKVHWFFQRAGREGSDQNFFLPRVSKFKLDQTGWLHNPSFYTPFTQPQEITVKHRTIVTGHPVFVEYRLGLEIIIRYS